MKAHLNTHLHSTNNLSETIISQTREMFFIRFMDIFIDCWARQLTNGRDFMKAINQTFFPSKASRPFLSVAIGPRPRNYLSCCCSSCSSFGSFSLKNKFKWKKIVASWISNWGLLAPQPSTLSTELWHHCHKLLENFLFNLRISKTMPQTLDQYWSTLVSIERQKKIKECKSSSFPTCPCSLASLPLFHFQLWPKVQNLR